MLWDRLTVLGTVLLRVIAANTFHVEGDLTILLVIKAVAGHARTHPHVVHNLFRVRIGTAEACVRPRRAHRHDIRKWLCLPAADNGLSLGILLVLNWGDGAN